MLRSRLLPHLNLILQARYQHKKTVREVLETLLSKGINFTASSYHECLSNVLRRLSDDQAVKLGVNVPLLRAVRCRLRLPISTPNACDATPGTAGRFYARSGQRPVWVRRKTRSPVGNSPGAAPPAVGSQPPASVSPPAPTTLSHFPSAGTPSTVRREPTYQEWHTINARAVEKITAITQDVLANWHGTVVHLPTKREFTAEELMREFKLTDEEARSLFLTL